MGPGGSTMLWSPEDAFYAAYLKSHVLKKRPPVTLAVIAEMIEFVLLGLVKDRLK